MDIVDQNSSAPGQLAVYMGAMGAVGAVGAVGAGLVAHELGVELVAHLG